MELSKKFYINNCKVMQELYKKNIPAKKLQEVQVGNEKKPIICKFALRQSLEFTYFDKIVCDAVYTIWLFHQNNVSQKGKGFMILRPSEVLGFMSGARNIRARKTASEESVTGSREARIIATLEKLGNTEIAIDWKQDLEVRKLKKESPRIGGPMIPVKRIEGTNHFKLNLDWPLPLYYYASKLNQIINIPMEYLTCGKWENGEQTIPALKLANTDEVIMLKHILLQRLEMIRNSKNNFRNVSIRYYYLSHKKAGVVEGILPLMGILQNQYASDSSWSNKKQDIHKKVCRIMDYYRAIGYVESYEDAGMREGKNRRSGIVGINITGKIGADNEEAETVENGETSSR